MGVSIEMEKIRNAAVAGQFYPGNEETLRQQIQDCFLETRGCREIPKINHGEKNIKGAVVPHAGYIYSGAIASHSYCQLVKNGFADTFIIIGPNHTGGGSGISVMTNGKWKTPLGEIPINTTLAEKIHTGVVDLDETAHRYEHSIEVQLPFLQFVAQEHPFDFVPICMMMQDYETSYEVGVIVADAIKKSEKSIAIIASTDFSHAGFNYMSMPPPGTRVDAYAEKQDKLAIAKIIEMKPEGLIETVHKNNISMCGYGPVATMLVAAKKLGATKTELLKYGTSYEVYPGTSCVGYGSLIIY